MLIDWFTVAAQALNFLVLVWLLRRFLYKPILTAIDAREKRIADELADAAAKQSDAKKERDDYQQKNDEFQTQRESLLSKATEEAATEKNRLLEAARQAADAMSEKRLEALNKETQTLTASLTQKTQDEVFSIARKVLTDLADTTLEERTTTIFLEKLNTLTEEQKATLKTALTESTKTQKTYPPLINTAFDLPPEQQATIQSALNQLASREIPLTFQTNPELISGIELTVNGTKIAWSIENYLKTIEKGVGELLKEEPKPKEA